MKSIMSFAVLCCLVAASTLGSEFPDELTKYLAYEQQSGWFHELADGFER
jgi:hypothetical protein